MGLLSIVVINFSLFHLTYINWLEGIFRHSSSHFIAVGFSNHGLWASSGIQPVFEIKDFSNTATPIHLHVINGFLNATRAKLND